MARGPEESGRVEGRWCTPPCRTRHFTHTLTPHAWHTLHTRTFSLSLSHEHARTFFFSALINHSLRWRGCFAAFKI